MTGSGDDHLEVHTAIARSSRDIIGQAKGVLMERFDIDAVHAFGLLRRLSQDNNTPLSQIAERLVLADQPPSDERSGTDRDAVT